MKKGFLLRILALLLVAVIALTSCDAMLGGGTDDGGISDGSNQNSGGSTDNGNQNSGNNQGTTDNNQGTTDNNQGTTDNNQGTTDNNQGTTDNNNQGSGNVVTLDSIPAYSDKPFVYINGDKPYFTASDYTTSSYERYGALDSLGRCTVAMACIGRDLMPTEDRGNISSVYPTGWKQATYSSVPGSYLYNRCHLIGWQLSGENANEKNLITGTQYLNIEGMLPFENMVADYVKETNNHVMYRVTPIFDGNNLLANGVLIEAYSVEDNGEGISFCVYVYNVQPDVILDYTDGSSSLDGGNDVENDEYGTFILNTNSKKIHRPDCSSAAKISDKNRQEYEGWLSALQGYSKCLNCFKD